MIEQNKTLCKVCNQLKDRIQDGTYFNGKDKRWRDANGMMWSGKTCPDCNRERSRVGMGKTRAKRKEIKALEKTIQSLKNS